MSGAYYNEIDPLKAEVIREAIKANAIAPGDVDERSIADVESGDLVGYTQCHFFAGGGFWSLAARLAGWPDDRPLWTGSCPCPSFSAAGKGGGFDDPRHLWPHWDRIIEKSRPAVIFGEQADDAIGYGWLDLVQTDLEAKAYAVGAAVLGACSVGAPHMRQRLYFVADTESERWAGRPYHKDKRRRQFASGLTGKTGELGDTSGERLRETWRSSRRSEERLGDAGESSRMAYASVEGHSQQQRGWDESARPSEAGVLGGFWADAEWIPCRVPEVPGAIEWRAIKPGSFCLATRYPGRVAGLRIAGDGICVPLAQAFIESYLELRSQ